MMMFNKVVKQFQWGNHPVRLETGEIARQAGGAALVDVDETLALATVVGAKSARPSQDFFPLTVDYIEKSYAAGRIPGGFFRREGRPSEGETLISRLIDRPLRPLFPEGLRNEVQIVVHVLSLNPEVPADIPALIGASAALALSGIPFNGPIGAARVAYINGQYALNPTRAQMKESALDLVVAGTEHAVLMVESEARQLYEDFRAAYQRREKTARSEQLRTVRATVTAQLAAEAEAAGGVAPEHATVNAMLFELEAQIVRAQILSGEPRIDGRSTRAVRPISIRSGVLPRAHGSALFTRGETQALAVTTLGTKSDEQMIDAIEGEYRDRFMLHYNMPPFATGETGRVGAPKRREIGHGRLARRA